MKEIEEKSTINHTLKLGVLVVLRGEDRQRGDEFLKLDLLVLVGVENSNHTLKQRVGSKLGN